jgi:hypothetical protein
MGLDKMYTDYFNKTVITLPDAFIDVKTGNTHPVSTKIQEQIEYHAKNSTLIHLLLSALNQYFQPKRGIGGMDEIFFELSELKRLIQNGNFTKNNAQMVNVPINQNDVNALNLKELEEVLEAFGG